MHLSISKSCRRLLAVSVILGSSVLRVSATDYYFSNGNNDSLYLEAGNWTPGTIPDLTTTNTAHISNGSAVNYVAGSDLVIKNGGTLEVTNGSFTQTSGPAYLQLNGTGTILVDGGTFNQGTATSGPFNVSGTGNVFNMSSGAANFNRGFNVATGLTSTLSGGTLTVTGGGTAVSASLTLSGATATLGTTVATGSTGTLNISAGSASATGTLTNAGTFSLTGGSVSTGDMSSSGTFALSNATLNVGRFTNTGTFSMSSGTLTTTGEFDFNDNTNTLSGGTINTTLITGVNAGSSGNHVFSISGGSLTLSSNNSGGIYGGGATQYINFTAGSTGSMEFLNSTGDTVSTVQGFIRANVIEYSDTPYNATTGYANFSITQDGAGDIFLGAAGAAVPEPATFAAGGLLLVFAAPMVLRRLRRRMA